MGRPQQAPPWGPTNHREEDAREIAAQPRAAIEDVLATWKQLVALHHQWHSLLRELKDAELALGQDATDSNYGWLQDLKTRLAAVDGTEAIIEGFGESSGRAQKGM